MNQHKAKVLAPLVAAMAEGKTIQFHCHLWAWKDDTDPQFDDYPPERFRIKPEPREFIIALDSLGRPCGGHRAEVEMDHPGRDLVRVREIL